MSNNNELKPGDLVLLTGWESEKTKQMFEEDYYFEFPFSGIITVCQTTREDIIQVKTSGGIWGLCNFTYGKIETNDDQSDSQPA